MKKQKKFRLRTMTDIKVFILFLLNNIGYPIDHTSVIGMVSENTEELLIDYDECLRELSEDGHLYRDDYNGEEYYMISDSGRRVAAELYDSLDKGFRERSMRLAIKHISLSKTGAGIKAYITETESKRFKVTLEAFDRYGEIMSTSITVNSKSEAELIKKNYEAKPDGVYRGVLFSVTGKLEYIS